MKGSILRGQPVQRTSALASADSELVNAMGATAEVTAALQRSEVRRVRKRVLFDEEVSLYQK